MAIQVLLMEDDSLTRSAIATALMANGYEIVAQVSNVTQALEIISNTDVDVAVLDLDVGVGPTGLDLADFLARRMPNLATVILTSSVDPRLIRSSLPPIPPNSVYVIKQDVSDMSIITGAIEAAMASTIDSSHRASNHLIDQIPLSDVQMETLRLVAQGLSNSEIAKQRFVTEKTVEYTINKIASSLGIESTASANQRVHIARMYFRLRGQG